MPTEEQSKNSVAAESRNAEALHTAAIASEAASKARRADLDDAVATGLDTFFEGRKATGRFIDINRIPFICDDIAGIHKTQGEMVTKQNTMAETQETTSKILEKMVNDLSWMKWIGGGFVMAAGALAMKALGI